MNAERKTTFVNAAAERLMGWSAAEMFGGPQHAPPSSTTTGRTAPTTLAMNARSTPPFATAGCAGCQPPAPFGQAGFFDTGLG